MTKTEIKLVIWAVLVFGIIAWTLVSFAGS